MLRIQCLPPYRDQNRLPTPKPIISDGKPSDKSGCCAKTLQLVYKTMYNNKLNINQKTKLPDFQLTMNQYTVYRWKMLLLTPPSSASGSPEKYLKTRTCGNPLKRLCSVLIAGLIGAMAGLQAETITVDTNKTHQRIEGFGTATINWGPMNGIYTKKFVENFYHDTVGLNMQRIPLTGSSEDFFYHKKVENPSQISASGIEPGKRSQVDLTFAKQLVNHDPQARVIGSVWSPPAWMKESKDGGNGTFHSGRKNRAIRADAYKTKQGMSKNRVLNSHYEHMAQWLVAVVEYLDEEGIELYGLSFANEPRFSQWYNSTVWTGEDYAEMLVILDDALSKAGYDDIRLYGPEDMTGHMFAHGTRGMVDAITSNRKALKALDRWATHGYTDGVQKDTTKDSSAKFWNYVEQYDKPYWMTEGGTGGHRWPSPITGGIATAIHNSQVGGNASAFVPWQISEKKRTTHAIAYKNEVTPKTASGMQYFRTIKPDSVRIDAEPAFGDIQASAYLHEQSGQLSIIVINAKKEEVQSTIEMESGPRNGTLQVYRTSQDEKFETLDEISLRNGSVDTTLEPMSVTSYVIEKSSGLSAPTSKRNGPLAPKKHKHPTISEVREWQDKEGRTVSGALVGYNGKEVILRVNEKDYRFQASNLSSEDHLWLEVNYGKELFSAEDL